MKQLFSFEELKGKTIETVKTIDTEKKERTSILLVFTDKTYCHFSPEIYNYTAISQEKLELGKLSEKILFDKDE